VSGETSSAVSEASTSEASTSEASTSEASTSEASTAAALATGTPHELEEAATTAIARTRAGVATVKAGGDPPLVLLDAYDEAMAALNNTASQVDLIAVTHPDAAMRDAAEAAKQALANVGTDISLDRALYDVLAGLDLAAEDAPTRHYLEVTLRAFRRSGVDRDDAVRARVRELQEELVGIGQDFDRNIRTDTRTAAVPPTALAGLPEDYVRAHPAGDDGLVRITTEYPDYVPFQTYSTDGNAREQLWRLFRQRGYPTNVDTLRAMVERRYELATLLGYPDWAEYAAEDKMVGTAQNVADFIARIAAAAADRSQRDYDTLLARKQVDLPGAEKVLPWDTAYLDDRVKAEQLAFDTQAMRPYFEYERVKAGLMGLVERLFGVTFSSRADVPVWHPDVVCYDVLAGGELLGRIFLDMFPRADKFNHGAMFPMNAGKAGVRIPECALVCNLPRPGDEPALLQHSDVETFFHEFGHLIHHVFAGRTRWAGISGVATEWDFVEAPSQLLEEWVRDAPTLATFAVHHETGEPLPTQMVTQLRSAEEFGKGMFVRQQMFYATLSLELYRRDPAGLDMVALEKDAQERLTPFAHVPDTYLHLSFGHLDGYSAIYATYMWSLVIAKDLFTVFAREGLLSTATAGRYREAILAPGGSAPAAELVQNFLGRPYNFAAYQAWLDAN
jgi:thimet oligopeptidase